MNRKGRARSARSFRFLARKRNRLWTHGAVMDLCDKRANSFREAAMPEAFICDAVRTPIGRYAGALAKVRTDDLAAVPLKP